MDVRLTQRRRTALLATLLLLAGVLVSAGAWLASPALGLVIAGLWFALWALLVVPETPRA